VACLTIAPAPAGAATGGCGADEACVSVKVVDGSGVVTASRELDADELRPYQDITDAVYRLKNTAGRVQSQNVPWAVSLRALVSTVPLPGGGVVDPSSVTFVEVVDDSDLGHPLTGDDLAPAASNGFVDDQMPAVFINTGAGSAHYIRPLRSNDPDDLNVTADPNRNGWVAVAAPDRLEVVVHTAGTLLAPTITASTLTTKVGAGVRFGAVLSSPTALTYSWDFRDGGTSAAAAPSHAWKQSGTYYVNLTVRGADGSFGRAKAVLISVSPRPTTAPSVSPGGTGSNPATSAPDTGPSTSKGRHHGGRASSSAQDGADAGAASGAGPSAPTDTPRAAATATAAAGPTLPPGSTRVRGIALVASGLGSLAAQDADVNQPQTRAATAAAARARAESESWSWTAWVAAGVGVAVLLAAGMATETTRTRRHDRRGRIGRRRSLDGTMTP
jgi:chitodextrinase